MMAEHDHSDNLQCTCCNAVLPSYALFCGACGESLDASIGESPLSSNAPGAAGGVSETERGGSLAEIHEMTTEVETHYIHEPEEDAIPRLASTQPSGVKPHISGSFIFTRLPWLWQVIIILSAITTTLVTFVFPEAPLRPIVVMWFLFVCPGMMLVRFLHLNQPVVEWVLALTLSLAIDAIVSGIVLYFGKWSPATILSIILGLSLAGAITQLTISNQKSA
jgi:hypothetical protein